MFLCVHIPYPIQYMIQYHKPCQSHHQDAEMHVNIMHDTGLSILIWMVGSYIPYTSAHSL